jgi:rSAM/selenodomain-associated transferase 1
MTSMPADDRRAAGRDRCAIAVMAKAPHAGRVKTRLVPPLTDDEAMMLSGCFLRDVTANIARAANAAPIDSFIAFAPAGTEPSFAPIIEPGTRLILADGTPDMPPRVDGFGRSLLHAARSLFAAGYGSVCLLNADSPNLPTDFLATAARRLAAPGDRVVLGPAQDGGYYLIGMKAPHPHLFENIVWSTDRVAAQTRDRARHLGLELVALPTWYDVDDAASLRVLLADLAQAPVTAEFLARQDIALRLAVAPRMPALSRP